MSTLTLYTFEDGHGHSDGYSTFDATEAYDRALSHGFRVLANEYEYTDREVAWDFTPPQQCCVEHCLKPAKTGCDCCYDHEDATT